MDLKNPQLIREKIINFLKTKGPSLPIHVSRETGLSMIFASAFLSELAADNNVKISIMKVGGSPLYLIPGQEEQLEKFYTYLPGKEREAFLLLKEKKVLEDIKLEPAIRVALRNIKDFAFPLIPRLQERMLFWKFHSLPIEQASPIIENMIKLKQEIKQEAVIQKQETKIEAEFSKPEIKQEIKIIAEKPKEEIKITQETELKIEPIFDKTPAKKAKSQPEDFLNEIKTFLTLKNISIISTEYYDKKEVLAKIRINSEDCLLFAFNKKRINEKELIKAYKKSLPYNLPYIIVIQDVISKKMKEFIDASKSLKGIETLHKKEQ
ncbi:hypothetical protein HYW76_01105 [Candidatus Pacearchaeota archaeon]|nr:hypothetical protein [Candidatus Pacearchaeota archaeon]